MRAFVDSSVFIWAVERPGSNSAVLYELLLDGRLRGVIDEKVLDEVRRFYRKARGRSFAWLLTEQIRRHCTLVPEADCQTELRRLRRRIKEKDLMHLAVARHERIPLIGLDDDFAPFREYLTPQAAVRRFGIKTQPTDW